LINALPRNSSVNTNRDNKQNGKCVFYAIRAGAVGSLSPGNESVNMQQQWETVFSWGFVQRSYLKNKRRYEYSFEFSVETSHGKFVVEEE
jgi:hypothetical protein